MSTVKRAIKPNPDTLRARFQESAKQTAELAAELRGRERPALRANELWKTVNGSLVLVVTRDSYDAQDEDNDDSQFSLVILTSAVPDTPRLTVTHVDAQGRAYNVSNGFNCLLRVSTDFSQFFSGYSL